MAWHACAVFCRPLGQAVHVHSQITNVMSQEEEREAPQGHQPEAKAPRLPNLSTRKLEKLRQKDAKRGIVYISRIPPHLVRAERGSEDRRRMLLSRHPGHPFCSVCPLQKPQKLRQMLEQYAEIGRVYLAPEGAPPPLAEALLGTLQPARVLASRTQSRGRHTCSRLLKHSVRAVGGATKHKHHCWPSFTRLSASADPALRKKRKQHGGNSGKNFTEGWVEFEDKAKAKEVRRLAINAVREPAGHAQTKQQQQAGSELGQ